MVTDTIKNFFGINCKIEKTNVTGLALYITMNREFFMVNMEGLSFLLVAISSKDRFGAIALKKQHSLIKMAMDCEVAFAFETLTKLQRDSLIEKNIPFIAGYDQIYLPFLGIALRNNFISGQDIQTDKMMPTTQSLFLYLMYNYEKGYILKNQAAKDLGLTKTSITRGSKQLKAMGLITEERFGKEIRMKTVKSGYELYRAAKSYLVTPVQRRMYIEKTFKSNKLLEAGESALSNVSMLGKPKYDTLAIYKGDNLVKEFKEIDIKWQDNVSVILVELWKYDPFLFAKDNMVDPVSLALSLSDIDDERVCSELEQYLEEYAW